MIDRLNLCSVLDNFTGLTSYFQDIFISLDFVCKGFFLPLRFMNLFDLRNFYYLILLFVPNYVLIWINHVSSQFTPKIIYASMRSP